MGWCGRCRAYHRAYSVANGRGGGGAKAAVRVGRIAAGWCHRCLYRHPVDGRVHCGRCLRHMREYMRERYRRLKDAKSD